ncbi:MAG: SRPBCC family protein [Ornithinimicrobium sp.]
MSNVHHATWNIERVYPVPPATVFHAWADIDVKRQWFLGADGRPDESLTDDFRVGGVETMSGITPGGDRFTYQSTYRDIVQDERIVTTYDMTINEDRISVSVVTVELSAHGEGTTLMYTEQGAYLDGLDEPESRQGGVATHLDTLGEVLDGVKDLRGDRG